MFILAPVYVVAINQIIKFDLLVIYMYFNELEKFRLNVEKSSYRNVYFNQLKVEL